MDSRPRVLSFGSEFFMKITVRLDYLFSNIDAPLTDASLQGATHHIIVLNYCGIFLDEERVVHTTKVTFFFEGGFC